MNNMIVRVYDSLEDAEQARDGLVDAGFRKDDINLSVMNDESGAMEGNFVLDYKDAGHDNDRSFVDSLFGSDDTNEGLGRSEVAWRGNFMLAVQAADSAQLGQAAQIAEQFGGVDIEQVNSRASLPIHSGDSAAGH